MLVCVIWQNLCLEIQTSYQNLRKKTRKKSVIPVRLKAHWLNTFFDGSVVEAEELGVDRVLHGKVVVGGVLVAGNYELLDT